MGNRVRQVGLAEAAPEIRKIYQLIFGDRDPVAQPGTATGSPGDYWTTLALVPPGRRLKPEYRELAILRTAIVGDSRFEYSQHLKLARQIGIPESKVQA